MGVGGEGAAPPPHMHWQNMLRDSLEILLFYQSGDTSQRVWQNAKVVGTYHRFFPHSLLACLPTTVSFLIPCLLACLPIPPFLSSFLACLLACLPTTFLSLFLACLLTYHRFFPPSFLPSFLPCLLACLLA